MSCTSLVVIVSPPENFCASLYLSGASSIIFDNFLSPPRIGIVITNKLVSTAFLFARSYRPNINHSWQPIMTKKETFDWEAKIAIEIIEKTWEEIMMVGVPNTSGVNQKDFVKNAMKQKNDERNGGASLEGQTKSSASAGNTDSKASDSQAEQGSNGNKQLDDTSSEDILSDAYRIQHEEVDAVGKTVSATAQETDVDVGANASTVKESSELRDKGEKGNASDTEGENNNECASPSSVNPQAFAATAITTKTSSPSAIHGIEEGLQYPSDNNSRRIAEVMDNTRCIFPSASKIASATSYGDHTTSNELLSLQQGNQKQPFITINPTYLESVTGDELLVAFDEIMAMAYTDSASDEPCSFILPEEATSASWIDLVRSYATTDTSKPESQTIPLYILVLCRFQHSLAMAYAGRNLTQACQDGQANGSESRTSYKSAAQWLSALMTRIRQLEKDNSPEIQQVKSNLASNLPDTVNETEDKKQDLEQYLLLPFKLVAKRLEKGSENHSDYDDILKKIDLSIGGSSQDAVIPSVTGTASVSTAQIVQAGDGVKSENDALPTGSEHQIIPNNGSNGTSNGRKGKKKKKKKVCFNERIFAAETFF